MCCTRCALTLLFACFHMADSQCTGFYFIGSFCPREVRINLLARRKRNETAKEEKAKLINILIINFVAFIGVVGSDYIIGSSKYHLDSFIIIIWRRTRNCGYCVPHHNPTNKASVPVPICKAIRFMCCTLLLFRLPRNT